jgi:acetyltransferase-like isoleucine patch superfamily enzyme
MVERFATLGGGRWRKFQMSFLSRSALSALGLHAFGKDVSISDVARFHNPGMISIGNNVRIDDFCVLSAGRGGIEIRSHVHLGCFSSLIGAETILLEDFSGISARVSIFSSSDDYSGDMLTNPTIPGALRKVHEGKVKLGRHVVVGAGSVILPGVTIGDGAAIGALTLVSRDVQAMTVSLGVPARRIGVRRDGYLDLERRLEAK